MLLQASHFRSLASLHRAGVPWPEALASAAGSGVRLDGVRASLASGTGLADALAPVVEPLDLALLRAAEHTGTFDVTLDRIAARHDAEERDRGRRHTALLYPVLMAHVAAVLLPIPDLVQGRGLASLLWSVAVLVPTYAFLYLSRRRRLDATAHAHPGVRAPRATGFRRNAVEEADARGFTALADCLQGGVPLNESLELVRAAGVGGRVAWDVHRAMPRVRDGKPLADCWQAVPPPYREELTVAEEAGELADAAHHAAARLRFGVEMRRKKVAAVLPVALLLLVAAVVAWRLFSFYGGVYRNLPGM